MWLQDLLGTEPARHASYASFMASSTAEQLELWLLRLPPNLEDAFHRDTSVQRTLTAFDAVALTQAVLVNGRMLKLPAKADELPDDQQHLVLPHDYAFCVVFFALAFVQTALMLARPAQYLLHRRTLSFINRSLRLLAVVGTALLLTPELAARQGAAYVALGSASGDIPTGHSHVPANAASSTGTFAAAAAAATGPSSGHEATLQAVLRMFLAGPMVYLLHANFMPSFKVALFMQLATFASMIVMEMRRLCALLEYDRTAVAVATSACEAMSWVAHAGTRLLDIHLPAAAPEHSTASLGLCGDTMTALLLLKILVDAVVLVLVPCIVIYCLERSMKLKFLASRAALTTEAAASSNGQDAGPSQGSLGADSPAGPVQQPMPAPQLAEGSTQLQAPHQEHLQLEQQQQEEEAHHHDVCGADSSSTRLQATQQQQQQQLRAESLDQLLMSIPALSPRDEVMPGLLGGFNWWAWAVRLAAAAMALVCWWCASEAVMAVLLQGDRRLVCDAEGWLRLV